MIEMVIEKRRRDLGGGFEVRRLLPFAKRRMVGPFIFFDHFGPLDLAPGIDRSLDVRPHPHIGLSTVSYLFSGEIMHRDSLGYEQAIRPREVSWMTAGSGITHSERFELARAHGDRVHGIQAWVALPDGQEETAPSFSHHPASDLPHWDEAGVVGQLIAGSAYGLTAGARTYSPLFYAHLDIAPGRDRRNPGGPQGTRTLHRDRRGGDRRHALRCRQDADLERSRLARPGCGAVHSDGPWRRAGRRALHLLELRVLLQGPTRPGGVGLEGGKDEATGCRRRGVHPAAGRTSAARAGDVLSGPLFLHDRSPYQ